VQQAREILQNQIEDSQLQQLQNQVDLQRRNLHAAWPTLGLQAADLQELQATRCVLHVRVRVCCVRACVFLMWYRSLMFNK
jgi:hypothetical protein